MSGRASCFALLLCVLSTLGLVSCGLDRFAGGSSTTDTGNDIKLAGRVVDKDNAPLPGVVVMLARLGLADTTDGEGRYEVQGTIRSGRVSPGVLDTLIFLQGAQEIAAVPVTKWVAVIPDLKIMQRDISGFVEPGSIPIARVQAVVSGEGIPDGEPVRAEAFYNSVSGHYSVFVYFPAASGMQSYSVHIDVLDSLGRRIGRSPVVPFKNNAGNIVVPTFNANNALPRAFAGRDTTLPQGSLLALRGSAVDSFGIARWEWKIGGAEFRRAASGDTTITLPETPGTILCVLRVTNVEGLSALDTLTVFVTRPPDTTQSSEIVWTRRSSGVTSTIVSVIWTGTSSSDAAGFFLGVGTLVSSRATILKSTDGVTWTQNTTNNCAALYHAVSNGPRIVAVGNGNACVSTDAGTSWTSVTLTGATLYHVAWNGTVFVAVGRNGSSGVNYVYTSPDGMTWTLQPTDLPATWSFGSLMWNGSEFWAVGFTREGNDSGIAVTSRDGVTWTQREVPMNAGGLHVARYYDGRFVFGTSKGNILTSTDGVNWTEVGTAGAEIRGMASNGTRYVGVGSSSTVVSDDALNWTRHPSGTSSSFYSAVYGRGRFVAVGSGGMIITMP